MENFNILENIINNYIVLKSKSYSQFNSNINFVVSESATNSKKHNSLCISKFNIIINNIAPKAYIILNKDIELHRKDGHLFNVFELWSNFSGIPEPTHSRLIHFLLFNHQLHGQKNKFLLEFLNILNIEHSEKGRWDITAENGRVDIMLKRDYPPSVIIIENKSNWARDQENQMYRYWYENIYNKTKEISVDFYENNSAKYQIIYLPPNKNKHYEEQSITKPNREWFKNLTDDSQYNNLPSRLPLTPKIMTFDEDITHWLQKCIEQLDSENHPLKNYINQYINYCKKL